MTTIPIATMMSRGNSAAGTTALLAEASRAPLQTPRERYQQIAFRLNVTTRQAELLWFMAQREIASTDWLMARMGLNSDTIKVHASNLRKHGFAVKARKFIGYFLCLADRERVLAAASVAPQVQPLVGVSSLDFGGRECPPPFQPPGDLTRQPAQHIPPHSVSTSCRLETNHDRSGETCPTSGKLHP
jgi:biotin operon repressor